MQRPVMDPTFVNPNDTVNPAPRRPFAWAWKAFLRIGKVMVTSPFKRRRHFRVEDGNVWQRVLRGLIYRMALVPVLLVGFLTLLVLAATHPGRASLGADPMAFGVYYDPVSFLSEDNVKLEAWLVPAIDARRVIEEREATLQKKSPAIVLVHDFAASRQQLLPLVRPLHDRGFVVLVLELRGAGALTSRAQTFGLNESKDVRAAVDMLRRRAFIDTSKIAVLGVGTGANAALLATRGDPGIAALVVSNPIDGFDQAFERRVGNQHAWLPPLRTLFRWTFQVMYSVDTEDLNMRNFKDLINARTVLVMDPKRELLQPGAIRDVEHFLAARLKLADVVTAGAN